MSTELDDYLVEFSVSGGEPVRFNLIETFYHLVDIGEQCGTDNRNYLTAVQAFTLESGLALTLSQAIGFSESIKASAAKAIEEIKKKHGTLPDYPSSSEYNLPGNVIRREQDSTNGHGSNTGSDSPLPEHLQPIGR